MDVRICLLLAAEAGLALVLLWSAGVLRKPAHVLCAALLLAAAFVLRGLCLNYETSDYTQFLSIFSARTAGSPRCGSLWEIIMYRT